MEMAYAYKKGSLPLGKIPVSIRKRIVKAANEMTFKQLKDFFVLKRSGNKKKKNAKKGKKSKKAFSAVRGKSNIRIIR